MTTRRNRLLARLLAAEPRVVQLIAGAGFAKSPLAHEFARRFDRHAICDCQGVASAAAFANRVIAALESEMPGGSDALATQRVRLHVTQGDDAAWSRALLDVWKSRNDHSLLILERAECLADDPRIIELLGDMLASRPAERVLLVSSRTALQLRLTHHVAPHQVVTFTEAELRYEPREATSAFDGSGLPAHVVERIVRLANGWPAMLLLLGRFALYESTLDELRERLINLGDEERFVRLGSEILAELTPEMTAAMTAAASIPNATLEDISAATGIRNVMPIIERLLHLPGFITAENGTYQVHPLLRSALRAGGDTKVDNCALRAATAYERLSDYVRAAELYLISGKPEAAAVTLDHLSTEMLQQPTPRLANVLTSIALPVLFSRAHLWIAMLPHRRHEVPTKQLYDEASALLRNPSVPASIARRLSVRLALLAQESNYLSEARAAIDTSAITRSPGFPAEERRLAFSTLALIAAKQGKFADSERFVDEAESIAGSRHVWFERERSLIAFERASFFGDWLDLQQMCEEELYAAQRAGDRARILVAAHHLRSAAWYRDDGTAYASANELLAEYGDAATAFPLQLAEAKIHAALEASDLRFAQQLVYEAIDVADAQEHALPRILYRVIGVLLLPGGRTWLDEARAFAQSIESPPLEASLDLLAEADEPADFGIFKTFADRVARSPLNVHRDTLTIELAGGNVRRGGQALRISDRGLELLAALAVQREGTTKEELAAAIWPNLPTESALNALKMCVSRTRTQLANKDAIVNTKFGYALNEHIAVDVQEYERLMRTARSSSTLGEPLGRRIEEAIRALNASARKYAASWAWFAPYDEHLESMCVELTALLDRASISI